MRILILGTLAFSGAFSQLHASIDRNRLAKEMEYLKNNAFLGKSVNSLAREDANKSYFDRGSHKQNLENNVPEGIVDLDQLYFSDSVSSGMAAPKKPIKPIKPKKSQAKE